MKNLNHIQTCAERKATRRRADDRPSVNSSRRAHGLSRLRSPLPRFLPRFVPTGRYGVVCSRLEYVLFVQLLPVNPIAACSIPIASVMSPIATSRRYSIATMGADGIGPEVVNAGVQVLKKLSMLDGSFKIEFEDYDWSSETYKKTGKYIPDGGLEQLKKHDAILFGAVGAPGQSPNNVSSMCPLTSSRCTRSHFTLGPPPRNLPNFPTICQRASYEDLPGHVFTTPERVALIAQLGYRSREFRR